MKEPPLHGLNTPDLIKLLDNNKLQAYYPDKKSVTKYDRQYLCDVSSTLVIKLNFKIARTLIPIKFDELKASCLKDKKLRISEKGCNLKETVKCSTELAKLIEQRS
jgi:hypothetical protein